MHSPLLNQHLGLDQRVECLAGQQLVAELAVEAFHVAVPPGTAQLDVGRFSGERGDPRLDRRGNEFRPIVRADGRWCAAGDEQIRQHVDHLGRAQLAPHPDRQALAAELIDDVEGAELAALACAILDEVVGPDMVGSILAAAAGRSRRSATGAHASAYPSAGGRLGVGLLPP